MLKRIAQAYDTRQLPLMTRQSYRHELTASFTLPFAMAMMEAGVIGVIARKIFNISDILLAVFTAAPMFAFLTSLIWAKLGRGRAKVGIINLLQVGILLCLLVVAVLPINAVGGYFLTGVYVLARCFMAGAVTTRSAVWRANYPRQMRGQITARLSAVMTLNVVFASLTAAVLMDANSQSFRVFYPIAALTAAVGVVAFSRVRVRREREMLTFENRQDIQPTPHGNASGIYEFDPQDTGGFWQVLRRDRTYRHYMLCQFILGAANMMTEAPVLKLAADTTDQLDPIQLAMPGADTPLTVNFGFIAAICLTQVIPIGLATATIGRWGKLLDRMHITRFRARQAWLFIMSQGATFIAATLILNGAIYAGLGTLAVGRVIQGLARGGGMIAWQLGHNDFASRRMVAVYMGIHLTLTGVRGAVFPFVGMLLFAGWPAIDLAGLHIDAWKGIGPYTFVIAVVMGTIGAVGFYTMARRFNHSDVPVEAD